MLWRCKFKKISELGVRNTSGVDTGGWGVGEGRLVAGVTILG